MGVFNYLQWLKCSHRTEFLLELRRFRAQWGKSKQLISDNASHFKLASSVFEDAWSSNINDSDVQSCVGNEGIELLILQQYSYTSTLLDTDSLKLVFHVVIKRKILRILNICQASAMQKYYYRHGRRNRNILTLSRQPKGMITCLVYESEWNTN